MSTAPHAVAGQPLSAEPKKSLTAVEIIENELKSYFAQREQAIGRVHALDGAIQSAQHLLATFRAEAAKAESLVSAEFKKVENEAKHLIAEVKAEEKNVDAVAATEVKKTEDTVVSIAEKL